MAVTATKNPDVYRVTTLIRDEPTHQSEIVAYVRVSETGKLDVYYSHHSNRSRSVPTGPWSEQANIRLPLSNSVTSILMGQVLLELIDYFSGKIRTLPAPINSPVEKVQW